MDSIKRLINVLEQRGLQPNFLINLEDTTSHESQLYFMVRDGEVASDQDAVQELYGEGLNTVPTSYRMLKSRVKRKLFNQLHLLDLQDESLNERKQMRLEGESLLYRANLLYFLDEFDLAVELLVKVLQVSKRYDFYELQLNAVDILKGVYYLQKDRKNFFLYTDEAERLKDIVFTEKEAMDIFRKIRIDSGSYINARQEVLNEMEEAINKLEDLWKKVRTYKIFELYYLLQVQYYEHQGDFNSVINFTKYAGQLVTDGIVNANVFDKSMNAFSSVYAHLRAGLYDKGLVLASQSIHLFDINSSNWFSFMENYVILALYKQDYDLAFALMEQVNNNKFFLSIPNPYKDRWLITNAFVNLVLNKVVPLELLDELKEASYISKDKLGFYIYVNVLEFMYLLLNHNPGDTFESYIDRYRKYVAKYLKSDKVERIKIFYKLIMLALREGFDYEKCFRKGEILFDKLKQTKAPGEAYAEVEIVPYEHLWELALEVMKQRQQPSLAQA